jgi:hypothetical protein
MGRRKLCRNRDLNLLKLRPKRPGDARATLNRASFVSSTGEDVNLAFVNAYFRKVLDN